MAMGGAMGTSDIYEFNFTADIFGEPSFWIHNVCIFKNVLKHRRKVDLCASF